MANEESPVNTEYISTVIVSVFARPMRSPTAPKISPPVAHPMTNHIVAIPPAVFSTVGSVPAGCSAFIAELRAMMKSC